jgi:acyl dehydratase
VSATEVYYEDVELGDEIGPIRREVTDEQVRQFVSIWGENRGPSRFTSAEVAEREGLPNPIVPGAMNIAIMSQLITGWSSTVTLRKLDVVFRGMVPHHQPLALKGLVTDKRMVDGVPQLDVDVVMENEEGTPLVIGKATVSIRERG